MTRRSVFLRLAAFALTPLAPIRRGEAQTAPTTKLNRKVIRYGNGQWTIAEWEGTVEVWVQPSRNP
jgi:hypothetical protein